MGSKISIAFKILLKFLGRGYIVWERSVRLPKVSGRGYRGDWRIGEGRWLEIGGFRARDSEL